MSNDIEPLKPRFTLAEAMKHLWCGPRALVAAIDGCRADELTPEAAKWLHKNGVKPDVQEKLFGIPYATIYKMVKGADLPEALAKAHSVVAPAPVVETDTPIIAKRHHRHPNSIVTPDEIIAMYSKGKTVKQIQQLVHISNVKLGKILDQAASDGLIVKRARGPRAGARHTVEPAPNPICEPTTEQITLPVDAVNMANPGPIIVRTYKPIVPAESLKQYRGIMEGELARMASDLYTAFQKSDFAEIAMLSPHAAALKCAVTLFDAELVRCKT